MGISCVGKFTHEVGDRVILDDGQQGQVIEFRQCVEAGATQNFLVRAYRILTLEGPFKGKVVTASELMATDLIPPPRLGSRFDQTE